MSKEKMMRKIRSKNENELTDGEKLYLIFDKLDNQNQITYDEFKLIMVTNVPVSFSYSNMYFEILTYTEKDIRIYSYNSKTNYSAVEDETRFSSLNHLLDEFRFDNKTLVQLWEKITF